MPLQKQPYAFQFVGGIDAKTDTKQVGYTKLLDLQNAVFLKNGTLSKRNGYEILGKVVDDSGGLPYPNPVGLATHQGELVLFAGASSYSYRPESDTWSAIGAVSSVVATGEPIARTGTAQSNADSAQNGGVTACAWEDSLGGVWLSVVDEATGRELLAPMQLDSAGQSPRCVACGTNILALWVDTDNALYGQIWCAVVNPAAPELTPTPILVTSDLSYNAPVFDACPTHAAYDEDLRPAVIVWPIPALSGSPAGYRVGYLHQSGVLGSPVTGLPTVATYTNATDSVEQGIACAFDLINSTSIAIVRPYASAFGDLRVRFVSPSNLSTSSHDGQISTLYANFVRIACEFTGENSSGNSVLWWAAESTMSGSTVDLHAIESNAVDTAGNVMSTAASLRGHCIASRAFYDNGDVYCSVVHGVLYFPYVAIVQLTAGLRSQGRLLAGMTTGVATRNVVPSCTALNLTASSSTSRQHALPLGYRIQLAGSSGTQFSEAGVYLHTLDFDHSASYRWAELGRGLYLAGAQTQHYDGNRWAEADFHCAPDTYNGVIATTQATGGSLTTTEAYGYVIIYEEIDGEGELHPGPASVQTDVVLSGSNDSVTLTIPTYRLTSKRKVRIGVFRSLGNESSTFYRVTSTIPGTSGANGYLLNDPTVDYLTFTDNMSDATAETLEPLYTDGGILSNDPCVFSGEAMVAGMTRLFWLDPYDANVVHYSQQLRDDTACEMSASLTQRIDPLGGDIVALAVMDNNVIVFKQAAIFAFGGPGPDADGDLSSATDAWTPPQIVTSDVGCTAPTSVANSPDGIVFQSSQGIPYLLGRDLQVKRIGDDVWGYREQSIVRATLLPDRPHIIFLTDQDQGSTLLYDYDRGQWSRFMNHVGLDAVVSGGVYYYLGADGNVYQETPGVYMDGYRHIPMVIETAWIKMAGYLQGWQKVIHAAVVGNYISSHSLQVRYRINYQESYNSLALVDMDTNYNPQNYGAGNYGAGPYGGTQGPTTVWQQQFHLNKRCQSISFQFSDVESPTVYGAAFELSELLLTGGVLGVKYQMGSARSQ